MLNIICGGRSCSLAKNRARWQQSCSKNTIVERRMLANGQVKGHGNERGDSNDQENRPAKMHPCRNGSSLDPARACCCRLVMVHPIEELPMLGRTFKLFRHWATIIKRRSATVRREGQGSATGVKTRLRDGASCLKRHGAITEKERGWLIVRSIKLSYFKHHAVLTLSTGTTATVRWAGGASHARKNGGSQGKEAEQGNYLHEQSCAQQLPAQCKSWHQVHSNRRKRAKTLGKQEVWGCDTSRCNTTLYGPHRILHGPNENHPLIPHGSYRMRCRPYRNHIILIGHTGSHMVHIGFYMVHTRSHIVHIWSYIFLMSIT